MRALLLSLRARARELLAIYDRTGQGRWLAEAVGVHEQQVECRLPLPERQVDEIRAYLRKKYGIQP